ASSSKLGVSLTLKASEIEGVYGLTTSMTPVLMVSFSLSWAYVTSTLKVMASNMICFVCLRIFFDLRFLIYDLRFLVWVVRCSFLVDFRLTIHYSLFTTPL